MTIKKEGKKSETVVFSYCNERKHHFFLIKKSDVLVGWVEAYGDTGTNVKRVTNVNINRVRCD